MVGPTAMMLLVMCNDSYKHCQVAHRTARHYETVSLCEKELTSQVKDASKHAQQILGKCVSVEKKPHYHEAKTVEKLSRKPILQWHVSQKGDLYTKLL